MFSKYLFPRLYLREWFGILTATGTATLGEVAGDWLSKGHVPELCHSRHSAALPGDLALSW